MAKVTIPDIASQFASQEALNARFQQVEDELNNKVLYRTETNGEPNEMLAELDMNTNKIINLGEPVNPNDAARLQDLQTITLDPGTIIPTQAESVTLTAGQRTVDFVSLTTTGSSFNISGPDTDDARLVLGRDFTIITDSSIQLAQSYPAGSLIQLLRNVVGGEQIADVSYSQSESVTLADSQTTVVFNLYSTEYAGFYISGTDTDSGRLAASDYSLVSNSSIELSQSYPEGTTVTLLRNSTEAGSGGVTKITAGTNVTISPETGLGDVTINASVTAAQAAVLEHLSYNPVTRLLVADRAIETTLNSLYLGEQHKMSSGSENIFFTNLTSDINFYPMWGGLKDQSITTNRDGSGFIPPSGRVYSDMFSLPLGGQPDPLTSVGYAGDNYFGINITGLGITTVAAEQVNSDIRLEYRIIIAGKQVYMQALPRAAARSSAGTVIYPGDVIEWFFDHPVDVRAGTTLFAEIHKVRISDDEDLGIFQVRQGDTVDPNTGLLRYQATVHNRIFEDKDLELISPYLKYAAMDFGLDATGATILLRDLSLGTDTTLVPHPVNTLQAIANGTNIQIKIKDGKKILVESLPVSAVSIDGSFVNSVLNQAVLQLNAIFTNTAGFTSADTHVNGFALSGNDLTLSLNDGTSYTTDVTSLGVDENNFVASGTLSGSDLILTMDDATTVTVDASSLAVDTDTTISFGSLVGNSLTLTASDSSIVTIDVTALSVDTNLYVVSGTLNGTDLDLTMSDASVITVGVGALAIDNNTTIAGGVVSGTDIVLSLSDASIITIDATSLATGSSNEVVSGSVVGTNLVLVMADASEITIDATNMINGSSGLASNSGWYISYGANANQAVGTSTNDSTVNQQLPFYFGEALERGSEFKWNFQSNGGANLILGIWDGAEAAIAYNGGSLTPSNWGTAFSYAGGFIDASNSTLTTTNSGSKYVVANGDALGIRFLTDGNLKLMDLSGSSEVEIARTTIALSVTSFNIQMHTWANGVLPNGIISNSDFLWDIKHDYANTEAGVLNGVLTHTILERTLALSPGEQYMIPLDKQGAGETFGLDYTGAATGVITAEDDLTTSFKYQTNESIIADANWAHNTAAGGYFTAGGGTIASYRVGGAGTEIGLVSLRYMTDNTLELWSETNSELIATSVVHPDGSGINLHFGVNGNTSYSDLPVISKQVIGQGSQPDANFVPVVANQTVTVNEAEVLNFQIVSSDNIVNQFVELDAPSWMSINQNSGVLSGTAPAFLGTAADTIVVNCKAGNAVGGTVDFTVTVTVAEVAATYTNTKSLSLDGSTNWLQGNPVNMTALERASNGDGNSWTISMWVKPNSATATQTLMVYGAGDDYNYGAITLKQSGGTSLVLNYGTVYDNIILVCGNALTANTWQHVVVTFNGGYTGSIPADASVYYSKFDIYVDNVLQTPIGVASNGGYSGVISGSDPSNNIFRIGRASSVHNNYFGGIINQVAIWDTDQTANLATIYNSGAAQDLSLLTVAPAHYYEIEASVTTIADIEGSAPLTGYNFVTADLVTDAP